MKNVAQPGKTIRSSGKFYQQKSMGKRTTLENPIGMGSPGGDRDE